MKFINRTKQNTYLYTFPLVPIPVYVQAHESDRKFFGTH